MRKFYLMKFNKRFCCLIRHSICRAFGYKYEIMGGNNSSEFIIKELLQFNATKCILFLSVLAND